MAYTIVRKKTEEKVVFPVSVSPVSISPYLRDMRSLFLHPMILLRTKLAGHLSTVAELHYSLQKLQYLNIFVWIHSTELG